MLELHKGKLEITEDDSNTENVGTGRSALKEERNENYYKMIINVTKCHRKYKNTRDSTQKDLLAAKITNRNVRIVMR